MMRMMNLVFTLSALIFSTSLFSKDLTLDSGSVYLGQVMTSDSVTLHRSSATPKKVRVEFSLNVQESFCADYRTETVHRPQWRTHVTLVCRPQHHRRHGKYERRDEECTYQTVQYWDAYFYEITTVCARYDWRTLNYSKGLTLNFKNAAKLRGNEEEAFTLNLHRNSDYSTGFSYSAQGPSNYKISKYNWFFRLFGFQGLDFDLR